MELWESKLKCISKHKHEHSALQHLECSFVAEAMREWVRMHLRAILRTMKVVLNKQSLSHRARINRKLKGEKGVERWALILLMSLHVWRKTHRAAKYKGYIDFKGLRFCAQVDIYYDPEWAAYYCHFWMFRTFSSKNHVCVVALKPDLRRVSFHDIKDFLPHSITAKFLSLCTYSKVLHKPQDPAAMMESYC